VITDAAGRHYTSVNFDGLLALDLTEEVRVSLAETALDTLNPVVTQFRRRSD
jgi:hypothetical protein